jgi:hypothetical protein
MDEVLKSVGMSFVVPTVTAFVALRLADKFLPASARSSTPAVAFALGYCAASLLLRRWSDLVPTRHFHWPFYLALAGAVLGPLSAMADRHREVAWRWQRPAAIVAGILAALLSAFVVVPTYAALTPARWVQIPLLAAYLFLLGAAFRPLAGRVSPATLVGLASLSALTIGLLAAGYVSLAYGMGAMMAAGALAGCCAALWLVPRGQGAASLVACYTLVVGAWAYIGARETSPWIWGLLAAAMAPLALWVLEAAPLSRLTGIWKTTAQCAIVGSALGAAVAWCVVTVR